MGRKKADALNQVAEKGIGTQIPEKEISSTPQDSDTEKGKSPRVKKRKKFKRKETFRKTLELILSMEISPETVSEAVRSTPLGEKITYQEAILLAQVIKASCGDTQSAVFIRDTSGNKLKDCLSENGEFKPFEDF